MSLPAIELISFNICPFVQRSVITLLEKGIEFKTTYIDLAEKPAWFLSISPLGKVPVLRIGEDVLFESAVINEFLDEITPPSLHPSIPLEKARHRAWIEFSSDAMKNFYQMVMTQNKDEFVAMHSRLKEQLGLLELQVTGPLFAGEQFSLVDTGFAPLFMRIVLLEKLGLDPLLGSYPKVKVWADHLLARPSIKNSVVDDFAALSQERLKTSDSYLASHLT